MTTSSVSQHVAALATEVGSPLVEPVGRRVRLTPAGRRLAEHAVTILAAVDAARRDLDPSEEPHGVVRVAGFATAIRRSLLPVVAELATSHPGIEVRLSEYEPLEALDLLGRDDIDLALVYDYNLTPIALRTDMSATELWSMPWGLGVPSPARASTLLDVRRSRLDRELAQHRRRGRAPHAGLDGRVHPADRAPHRQPRAGRGPHRSPGTASACCHAVGRRDEACACSRSPTRRWCCAPTPSPGTGASSGHRCACSSSSCAPRRTRGRSVARQRLTVMSASLRRSSTSVCATSASWSDFACSTICDLTLAYGGTASAPSPACVLACA